MVPPHAVELHGSRAALIETHVLDERFRNSPQGHIRAGGDTWQISQLARAPLKAAPAAVAPQRGIPLVVARPEEKGARW